MQKQFVDEMVRTACGMLRECGITMDTKDMGVMREALLACNSVEIDIPLRGTACTVTPVLAIGQPEVHFMRNTPKDRSADTWLGDQLKRRVADWLSLKIWLKDSQP